MCQKRQRRSSILAVEYFCLGCLSSAFVADPPAVRVQGVQSKTQTLASGILFKKHFKGHCGKIFFRLCSLVQFIRLVSSQGLQRRGYSFLKKSRIQNSQDNLEKLKKSKTTFEVVVYFKSGERLGIV
jgi:hypothetical protein